MPWYFLSRTRLDEINRLQVPENDAGEEAIPRLCLVLCSRTILTLCLKPSRMRRTT
jgi:hypothetical protein